MVISQPQGIILHILIVLHNAASIALNASENLMFYTCNYNIRVTHEMVLLSIFYTGWIHGGIISRLFFIHFVAPCACSLSSG